MTFLTDADLAMLTGVIREAAETEQAFNALVPIQLRRRDTNGNFANAGTPFTPIDITLADRLEQVAGTNGGRVEIVNGGTMRVFAPRDVRRDDRFAFNGATAEVTLVEPEERGGVIPVNFRLLGGK